METFTPTDANALKILKYVLMYSLLSKVVILGYN